MTTKYTDDFKQPLNDRPRGIPLTDSNGTVLTFDSDAPGFYEQTTSGAETVYFYIDALADMYYVITDINVTANASETLAVALQVYVLGAWKEKYAYTMSLTGTQALGGMNTAYPLIEDMPPGTKCRLAVTTGGTATVAVNVMGRYKA